MTGTGITTHIENTRVLRDMKQYLGNPETIKDLYEALQSKLSKEDFYDLHNEERGEIF